MPCQFYYSIEIVQKFGLLCIVPCKYCNNLINMTGNGGWCLILKYVPFQIIKYHMSVILKFIKI